MNNRLYGNLIFELSKEGRKGYSLPKNNYGDYEIPASLRRNQIIIKQQREADMVIII